MKRFDLAVVLLRLMSIYIGINVITSVPWLLATTGGVSQLGDQMNLTALVAGVVITVCNIGVCFALWFFAPRIAGMVETGLKSEGIESLNVEAKTILDIGLVILGVFVLTEAIPALAQIIAIVVYPQPDPTSPASYLSMKFDGSYKAKLPISKLIFLLAELGIGLFLIFGYNGICQFILKARNAGRPNT